MQNAQHSLHDTEEQLHSSRARDLRFRVLLDSVPAPIWVTGPAGAEYLNRAMVDFLQVPPADLQGKHWFDYVHERDRERLVGRYAHGLAMRKPFQEDVRLRRGDGVYRRMLVLAQPRHDGTGAAQGFVGAMFDVTEYHDLVDDLRLADRRKNEFIAMLAHELRNPLAPLGNVAQLLKSPGVSEGTLAWAYDVLQRQLRNVRRLVDDLLDVSRVTQGKVELACEPLDLCAMIARIVEGQRAPLTAKRLAVQVTVPQRAVMLYADPTRLEQVFANLLNNAIKFTPPARHIWVTVTLMSRDNQAIVRVRDEGLGIASDILPHIFDPFTQGDVAGHRELGGLGIGLTLVRKLVELHGGSVEAASPGPGRGSEFTVRLPLKRD